jgi:two-component sensor histidine kinase
MIPTESFATLAKAAADEASFLEAVAHYIRQKMGSTDCDIFRRISGGGLQLVGTTHIPQSIARLRIGRGVGLIGKCLAGNEEIVIKKGLDEDPRSQHLSDISEEHFKSGMAFTVPGTRRSMGVVFLRSESEWDVTEEDKSQFRALMNELGQAWTIYASAFGSGSGANKLGAAAHVAQTVAGSPYLEEILQLLVTMTARQFKFKVVTVRLLDERRQELILRATQATHRAYKNKRAIKLGESIAGRVMRESRPIVVEDVEADTDYVGHDLAQEQGLKSMICLPLSIQGRSVGVISCYTGEYHNFTEDEVNALEALANQAAISIEYAQLQVRRTLMQEMHHRVKNSLQQVASLLRLEIGQGNASNPTQALTDSLGRILAISSVHDLLSRDDLDSVTLKSIAESLANHAQQSLVLPTHRITFVTVGDDAHLDTTQATQVALILNELVQNAVEHGFKETTEGEIHTEITLRDTEIGVKVSNTGDPLPADYSTLDAGLGLQIIQSLVRSLGGIFEIASEDGRTVAQFRFVPSGAE